MDAMDIRPPKRRPIAAPQPRQRPRIQLGSTRLANAVPYTEAPEEQFTPPLPADNQAPASAFTPTPPPTQPVRPKLQVRQPIQELPIEPRPAPKSAPKKQKKQRKRSHKLRWVVVTFVVLLVLTAGAAGSYWYITYKQPQKVSDNFVADMRANNPQAAYSLASSAFKAATTESSLAQKFNQASPLLQGSQKLTSMVVPKPTEKSAQAIYVYTGNSSQGKIYTRVVLRKAGSWQVYNFNVSSTPLTTTLPN